jgi:hypothetical protein
MKYNRMAAAFAIVLASGAFAAAVSAGIVVEEHETINRGDQPITRNRTIMIQGNKQKIVTDHDQMITDLDKDVMILINPEHKTYAEMPFPPKYPAGMNQSKSVEFKKIGTSRTVDGYKCEDYSGTSHIMGTESKIVECFSKDAPGAKDFANFQTVMNNKLRAAGEAGMAREIPTGVPMASDTTTNMSGLTIPGMAPEQAKKFAQMMANRPPIVTKSTVTKITMKSIPDSDFAPPPGYTLQKIPSRMAPPASAGTPPSGGSAQPPARSLPE